MRSVGESPVVHSIGPDAALPVFLVRKSPRLLRRILGTRFGSHWKLYDPPCTRTTTVRLDRPRKSEIERGKHNVQINFTRNSVKVWSCFHVKLQSWSLEEHRFSSKNRFFEPFR